VATSVASALDWWARTEGDRVALVFPDDQVTYADLRNWSSRVADLLASRGVQPGDRVGLLGGNTLEWAVSAHALLRAGAVIVPLNPRLVGPELSKLLTDSDARHVIADPSLMGLLDGVSVTTFDQVGECRAGGEARTAVERDAGEPIAVLFTSGSTGLSKGVISTNRQVLDIVFEATLREPALRPGYIGLMVLPLCFTPGLVWGLYMSGVLGGTLVVEATLDPSRAVRLIEQHRVSCLFGVPLIYQAMAAAPEFADADLSSLQLANVGGAAVPVALLQAWDAKGVQLRQIYGMTEAGGIATATLTSEYRDHPDSCGVGSVFTEFRVVRSDGTDCDPCETGEILMRGPGISPGYWNDPVTTAVAFENGWLRSGDLGRVDEAGRLTFLDRLKDLIISGGINVSPIELEAVIAAVPGVLEVAVIAAKDDRFGETPAAILHTDGTVSAADIVAHCATQVADYKVPRYVVIRDEPLPRLPNGKLSKRDVREEYDDLTDRFEKVR
jgi:acyl-CoA synthetase (AMP-forming)/AMP-acid ligase II